MTNTKMMKRIILASLILTMIVSLNACINDFECYRGNGRYDEIERDLDEFSEIESNSSIDIVLIPDTFNGAVIKGDDNIIDLVELRMLGKKLQVGYIDVDCIRAENKTIVELHFTRALESIEIDGSGEVVSKDSLFGDELEILINGSGNVYLEASYNDLLVEIDGSGDVEIDGKGDGGYVIINGSGDVDLFDFETNTMGVEVDGSGDTRVYVNDRLAVWINGSGDVMYRGDADLVIEERNGSGDVRKL